MAQSQTTEIFYVWRSGTLVHAQQTGDSEFQTSTDEADALEQAGYDGAGHVRYGQPDAMLAARPVSA
jgi:hypothetical protein